MVTNVRCNNTCYIKISVTVCEYMIYKRAGCTLYSSCLSYNLMLVSIQFFALLLVSSPNKSTLESKNTCTSLFVPINMDSDIIYSLNNQVMYKTQHRQRQYLQSQHEVKYVLKRMYDKEFAQFRRIQYIPGACSCMRKNAPFTKFKCTEHY